MQEIKINNDLTVFGVPVKNFPEGIGQTFDALVAKIPGGFDRPYYGISKMTNEGFQYLATAIEKYEGEAEKYNCKRYTVEKGDYLIETVRDWRKKTDMIKDVFQHMMQDPRADTSKPCVEWYKDDDVMVCMIKKKP
jgi:hypothetical protein